MKQTVVLTFKYLCIAVAVLLVVFLAKVGYGIYEALQPENLCGKTLGHEVLSPTGADKAVIYEFNCGAMDPFSTQISILPADEDIPFSAGNVFGAVGGERRGHWKGPYAEVEWLSPDHLHIKYMDDSRVHRLEAEVTGIKITSETL